jgi:hypothetical protein
MGVAQGVLGRSRRIHVIEAGHFVFGEAVDQVATLARAFLNKTLP